MLACPTLRTALPLALAAALAGAGHAAEAPAVDRYGDPLPKGALARLGTTRLRHESMVYALAFSPDGKTLATGGQDRDIVFWDVASGKEVRRWPAGVMATRTLAFSPDGKQLVAGGMDGAIRFYNPTTGKQERVLAGQHNQWVLSLAFSRDGKQMLSADQVGVVLLWDLDKNQVVRRFTGTRNGQESVSFLPDGKSFVVAWQDGTAHQIEAATGKDLRTFALTPGRSFGHQLRALAVSPDGKYLALGGLGQTVAVYEVATGQRVADLPQPQGQVHALAFLPGGRFLAVADHRGAHVCGLASGKELRRLDLVFAGASALAVSPDGRTLAVAHGGPLVRLLDVSAGRELHTAPGHQSAIAALAFLPDGKRLASLAGDRQVILWETATGRAVAAKQYPAYLSAPLSVAEDGRTLRVVGTDRAVHYWRPAEGGDPGEERREDVGQFFGSSFSISPDGKAVALVGRDQRLHVRDLPGGKERVLGAPGGYYFQMTFSPDSRRLATVGNDGQLRVWDRRTTAELKTMGADLADRHQAGALAFTGDGRGLLASDGAFRLYEAVTGQVRFRADYGPQGLSSLAVTADGLLAARGNGDGSVQVYDMATGREVAKFDGRQGAVSALAFSRDGRLLASGSQNATALVWRVPEVARPAAALDEKARERLWAELADKDAARAYRAVLALAARPAEAVPLLRAKLKPRPGPDPKRLAKLLADLDSDEFETRQAASKELAALGPDAEGALRRALDEAPSAEVRTRVEEVLATFQKAGPVSERVRFVRAVEALERAGTPAARQALEALAQAQLGPDLAREVETGLKRLAAAQPRRGDSQ
jgi:WD40 repeat protein